MGGIQTDRKQKSVLFQRPSKQESTPSGMISYALGLSMRFEYMIRQPPTRWSGCFGEAKPFQIFPVTFCRVLEKDSTAVLVLHSSIRVSVIRIASDLEEEARLAIFKDLCMSQVAVPIDGHERVPSQRCGSGRGSC